VVCATSVKSVIFQFAPLVPGPKEVEVMLSFEQAKKIILEAVPSLETETVSVREALGRVLAEKLILQRDFPDVRLSAVDGYAMKFGNGSEYKQVALIAAGYLPDVTLEPGQCAAVMTGGMVPEGADCVVMVEDCDEEDGIIKVRTKPDLGDMINEPAVEAAVGTSFMMPGTRINRAIYPAFFYAGIPKVKVYRRPQIGVLITGDELREVEAGHKRGQVFNTNRYILESFLDSIGVDCEHEIHVPDDEKATRRALDGIADKCDFIVSSGGVSMGCYDYIKKIFLETDFSLLVRETAIKPGRPLMVAKRGGKLFFGMPGYPSAFLTNALLYLVPALKKASGRIDYEHRWIKARLATPMRSRRGKLYLNRAVLELANGEWTARDPGSQKTSHFLNFADANGLVLLPEAVEGLKAGSEVRALHFDLELC
jgi:molybdopterin molybdotransferase